MSHYINESLSRDGSIAFNKDNAPFKSNTAKSIMIHLAWQYTDKYLAAVKLLKVHNGITVQANKISKHSNNGTPYIFKDIENSQSLNFQPGKYVVAQFTYIYDHKARLQDYLSDRDKQFMLILVNGSWYTITSNEENNAIFDAFANANRTYYLNTSLPNVKLPRVVSPIDSVSNALIKLRQYAQNNNISDFAVSSFATTQDILAHKVRMTMSSFSSFVPDLNEFTAKEHTLIFEKSVDYPYILDCDNKYLIFYANDKWCLIDDAATINSMTVSNANEFIDSMKNTIESTSNNSDLTVDDIYYAARTLRNQLVLNNVGELTHGGYFYVQKKSTILRASVFRKYHINADNYMSAVYNAKQLTLYKDSIVYFSVNVNTGLVFIKLPSQPNTVYATNIAYLTELEKEFTTGPHLDTVVSLKDVHFDDLNKLMD